MTTKTTNNGPTTLDPLNIVALSAYHAPSHRRWLQGLSSTLPHHFHVFTQPPRHFSWRSRGNSLSFAFDAELANTRADRVVATSMVDLAGLRGLLPSLARVPTVVYFHENQFAYPTRHNKQDANLLLTNLYTALAADRVIFNSSHNRRTFLDGANHFLSKMPDQVPRGVVDTIDRRSTVLPVPLDDSLFDTAAPSRGGDGPLRILWNHRWEHDKAPERFFGALFSLAERYEFRLVVLGQQFRNHPPIFAQARARLADRIDQWGWVEDRAQYVEWLRRSDVVVSTALHEFQGLAVQEAVAMGCIPVVPDRLAYPDFFASEFLYPSHADEPESDVAALSAHLEPLLADPEALRAESAPDLSHLRWSVLGADYDRELRALEGRSDF